MKQEKKLLFFDIDGTLAMPGDAPTEAVVNAMRSARSRGHLLILSTGRAAMSVPPEVETIGFDGYICAPWRRDGNSPSTRWSPPVLLKSSRAH